MVKICGLRRPEDALAANRLKPDLAGFILSPGFRRSIDPEQAQIFRKILSPEIRTVGVFVDAPFEQMEGFEVAGEDKVFHPAMAKHFWQPGGGYWDEAIIITSSEVKKPVAVRYCFKNFQIGNVKNGGNLPLFPFRTDDWR